jgi:RNA-directed DNA polymerase
MRSEQRDSVSTGLYSQLFFGGGSVNKPKPFEISKQIVMEAWKNVKANAGSAGIDEQSIMDCESDLKNQLYKLWNRMSSGSYMPPAVRGVDIPKKDGGKRRLGIPTVMDRVAQTVVKKILEPRIDPLFHENSFGYRPGRSAHDAILSTKIRCFEYSWVLEYDIKGMFDNISHEMLLKAVERHVNEAWIKLYIIRWLKAEMITPEGQKQIRISGTPQGGVISPLLANLFMHYTFDLWMNREFPSLPWCRYADDGLVHCASREQGQHVLAKLKERMQDCGLELHPEKTCLVYCKDGFRRANAEVTSFTFLGFDFAARPAKSVRTGKLFRSFQPAVAKNALKRMKHHIKHVLNIGRRTELSLEELAKKLNPVVQGWINYYGKFYKTEMYKLCRYLNLILSLWARRKFKRLYRKYKHCSEYVLHMYKIHPKLFAHWKFQPVY